MHYYFDYDFSRDYQKPNQWLILFQTIGGGALLLYGTTQIFSYLQKNGSPVFELGIGIIAILGGLSFLLYAMNGYKPIVQRGRKFIKIKQHNIHFKLRKFTDERIISLGDIGRIDFQEGEIVIGLKDNTEIWIGITEIQNKRKREDFIGIMKDIKSSRIH